MKIQNISYEISDYNSAYAVEIKFKCFNRSISVLTANVQCFLKFGEFGELYVTAGTVPKGKLSLL